MEATTLKKTISLRISPSLYEHIRKISTKENRSVNNYLETMILRASNFENKKIQTYSDETGDKIIEALNEHKKGETIKVTPQTLRDVSKRQTDWPIDDQSVQKSFTTTGDAPLQSYALLGYKDTEKKAYSKRVLDVLRKIDK